MGVDRRHQDMRDTLLAVGAVWDHQGEAMGLEVDTVRPHAAGTVQEVVTVHPGVDMVLRGGVMVLRAVVWDRIEEVHRACVDRHRRGGAGLQMGGTAPLSGLGLASGIEIHLVRDQRISITTASPCLHLVPDLGMRLRLLDLAIMSDKQLKWMSASVTIHTTSGTVTAMSLGCWPFSRADPVQRTCREQSQL